MIPRIRRLHALILHRTPVREKDRVVEVFSREEGRLRLLAAGVRRFPSRRAGHLEPLMETAIIVSTSSRGDSIRDARVLRAFPRLREHLGRLAIAYRLARLLRDGTGERLPDDDLYRAASALLGALDAPGVRPTPLFALSADLQLLRHLGLVPDLYTCARCRKPLRAQQFSFHRRVPSFTCRDCVPSAPTNSSLTDAVKVMRLLLKDPVPPPTLQIPDAVIREIAGILRRVPQPANIQIGLGVSVLTEHGRGL